MYYCRPGQFIFLRCPEIALFEWHPYSITSAPADPYLTVHIKVIPHVKICQLASGTSLMCYSSNCAFSLAVLLADCASVSVFLEMYQQNGTHNMSGQTLS